MKREYHYRYEGSIPPIWPLQTSAFVLIVAFCITIVLLAGCRTERIVTVPEHHYHVAHQRDTLIRTDSIYIHDSVGTAMSGDTFYITRTRTEYRDRWRDRVRIDSFVQRDSIPYPVKVQIPLTRWQTWSLRTGSVVLRLLAIAVGGGFLFLLARLLGLLICKHLIH